MRRLLAAAWRDLAAPGPKFWAVFTAALVGEIAGAALLLRLLR